MPYQGEMMRKTNKLKYKLKRGEFVLGTWNILPSSAVINVLGCAGLDFVVIDAEHGPIGMETAEDLVRAAEVEGMTPIIRVADNDAALVLRALDIGAHGVQIPHISNKNQAQAAVSYVKYPPLGNRGFSPFTRAGRYSLEQSLTHTVKSNQNTLVILNVEGKEGVSNLDQILEVEGIDVIFLGPYDLSQSVGKPGQIDDPEIFGLIQTCTETIRKAGMAAGCFARDNEMMAMLIDCRIQYITYLVDATVLLRTFEQMVEDFRNCL